MPARFFALQPPRSQFAAGRVDKSPHPSALAWWRMQFEPKNFAGMEGPGAAEVKEWTAKAARPGREGSRGEGKARPGPGPRFNSGAPK